MLLVVVVIIGAISTSKAGAVIKRQSGRIVCQIGGGTDCGKKPVTTHHFANVKDPLGHTANQPSGPPIGGGRPITVLPFPGAIGVSCTYDTRAPNLCQEGKGVGVTVTADHK